MYRELCSARTEMVKAENNVEIKYNADESYKTLKLLKVNKMKAPSFNGDIRDYSSFRTDFERIMCLTYGNDPFILKSCLTGDALDVVKRVDNDYDEMIRRLDAKYGRPEKVTDSILNEIKKLKVVSDGDHKKFILMVDTIEKCWLDLKQLNLQKEMSSATMISKIEKLLPSTQRREWSLRQQRILVREDKFPSFLEFLIAEKEAMEYMEDDLRERNKVVNKMQAHTANSEELQHEEESTSNIDIHAMLSSQLQQNQKILKEVVDGLAQVTNVISKPIAYGNIRSNTQYRNGRKFCWYHNAENHDISDCTAFKNLSGNDKFEKVKSNGACFVCLQQGHMARRCISRKQCDIVDNMQRCNKYHHPILHINYSSTLSHHNDVKLHNDNKNEVLLMFSRIPCRQQFLTTLWDPGANMSLITHESAENLGIKGKNINLSITKVGNVTNHVKSKEYIIPYWKGMACESLWDARSYCRYPSY